jgi:hypothetical protein
MSTLQAQITITIDGIDDDTDWGITDAIQFSKVIGQESTDGISDADDLSGYFKVLWDTAYIYFYLEVTDDVLHNTDPETYLRDNFGFYLDLKNTKAEFFGSEGTDSTTCQWEYQWENDFWGGRTATGSGGEWGGVWSPFFVPDSGTQYATIVTPGTGYTMEWKIPALDSFGIKLSEGDTIGFDTKIADNDGNGRDQMGWNMGEDMAWHHPSYFGTLKLLADGTVERISYLPTIDGIAETAWNQTPFIPLAKIIAEESTRGLTGANDLSGQFKLLWDVNNLYYYLEVTDDTLYTTDGNSSLNDNFGFYLDMKNQKTEFYGSDNSDTTICNWEYQWLNDIWGGRTATGSGGEWGGVWSPLFQPDSTVEYVAVVNPGAGYTIEWQIPVTSKIGIALATGDTIGFDTKVADNDGDGRDQKAWYMSSDIAWHKPAMMGTLVTVEGGTFLFSTPLSNVADLSSLSVSEGTLDPEFDGDVTSYTVELAEGTTAVPTVTASPLNVDAQVVISETETLPGATTVTVTAQDAITIKTYTINFAFVSSNALTNSFVEFKLSPNPADDYLDIAGDEVISSVYITNLAGQEMIRSIAGASNLRLNISSLKSGVYIVRIQTNRGTSVNKLIIQ